VSLTPTPPTPISVYDLPPLETGGVHAREGFAFQDHVAAGFCIDMLEADGPVEVWCESLDDITVLRVEDDGLTVEFVQAKASALDQLWSVAKLCEQDGNADRTGCSILESSLRQDRCSEPCRFRLVTTRPVKSELKLLTLAPDDPARIADQAGLATLNSLLETRVAEFRSSNGNDYRFWTSRTVWDVRHAESAVRDANLLRLGRFLNAQGVMLAPDQVQEVYQCCLAKVWEASRVDPRTSPKAKRFLHEAFRSWLLQQANKVGLPTAGADALEQKLKHATLPHDTIAAAIEQMRNYRAEQLQPKYLPVDERQRLEAEVLARLQRLKSRLDSGGIADDGVLFHHLCLEALDHLREELPSSPKTSLALLHGCMYTITGRCLHRYRRATVA
jgi:Cap4 dsDNA endonuclease